MNTAPVRVLVAIVAPLFAWFVYWWGGLPRDSTAPLTRLEASAYFSVVITSVLFCVFAIWLAWGSIRRSQYRAVVTIAAVGSAAYLTWALPLLYVGLPNFWRYLNIHG